MPTIYEQVRESITTNIVATIATSIKNKYAPFARDVKAGEFQRAYNPSNGNSWEGLNSLMFDIKKAEKNYPSNEWVTIKDAAYLGASTAEINMLKNSWQDKAVKVQYIAKKEVVNVYKTGKDGKPLPLLDENGKPRMGKDGNPLYQFEMTPQLDAQGNPVIDRKTNKPYMKIKTELRDLPQPVLKTDIVYNIAEFPSVAQALEKVKEARAELEAGKNINTAEIKNFNKFKPLNKSTEYKHILSNSKDYQADCKKVVLQDIKAQLNPVTAEQLTHYFNAQNFNRDYNVPKGFNEQQKQDIQRILDNQNSKEQDSKKQEVQKEQPKQEKQTQAKAPAPKKAKVQGKGR